MRKIFNKIFRYRLVSIYFILSQLVILTAIFGVLNTIASDRTFYRRGTGGCGTGRNTAASDAAD